MVPGIDLLAKAALLEAPWQPGIVAAFDGHKLAVAKLHGEFVWHSHAEADDVFLVLEGRIVIELRDGAVELEAGQLHVVPAGVEHRPRADEEAVVLLIEPLGTPNTGDADGATAAPERWL